MPLPGLTIIGESINDSVPSTKKLFDVNDLDGLLALARTQDEKGAGYIDVNVGRRDAAFMADLVQKIQRVTARPLSIDSPDPVLAEAGLRAYDAARAGGTYFSLRNDTAPSPPLPDETTIPVSSTKPFTRSQFWAG